MPAGYREACELAYKRLEEVSVNNSSDKARFRQVPLLIRPALFLDQQCAL